MLLSCSNIKSTLATQGFVEVPLPFDRRLIGLTVDSFLTFLSLPEEVKVSFSAVLDPSDRGSKIGYFRPRVEEGADKKEFFNFRGITRNFFQSELGAHKSRPEVERFFSLTESLYRGSLKTVQYVIGLLDAQHPGVYQKLFSAEVDKLTCLRLVSYQSACKGSVVAKPHYDRGSCTLSVAESELGLRVGKDEENLVLVERKVPSSGIFFPSFTFEKDIGVFRSNAFSPTWHDVLSGGGSRWSVVFFVDVPHNAQNISYEDTHTVKSAGA